MRYIEAADVIAAACELLGDDALALIDAAAVTSALAAAERTASDALHHAAAATYVELVQSAAAGVHTARVAALAALHLLETNHCVLVAEAAAAAKVLRAAAVGDVDVQELTRWFDEHVVPAGEEEPMFERFTDRARRVLVLAQEQASERNHNFIGTEHLLLALIAEGEGVAARALNDMTLSLDAIGARIDAVVQRGISGVTGKPPFTPRAKRAMELALREALDLGHNYIGTEHLLLGLVREGEGVAAQVLEASGARLPDVREAVMRRLSGAPGQADDATLRAYLDEIGSEPVLSDAEEDELGRRIQAGRDGAARLASSSELGGAERAALEDAVADGQRATSELVKGHLASVVGIAKQYRNTPGVKLLDLIQEGNLGLLQAAQAHVPGERFSLKATEHIRKAIARRAIGDDVTCSFCGKGKSAVKKLIAGPGVYICDECVTLCGEIIAEETPPTDRPAALRCPSCRSDVMGQLARADVLVDGEPGSRPVLACPSCGAILGLA